MRARIFESWMYADPEAIIERLLARAEPKASIENVKSEAKECKDRYYTQAKRIRIQRAMRERGP